MLLALLMVAQAGQFELVATLQPNQPPYTRRFSTLARCQRARAAILSEHAERVREIELENAEARRRAGNRAAAFTIPAGPPRVICVPL